MRAVKNMDGELIAECVFIHASVASALPQVSCIVYSMHAMLV